MLQNKAQIAPESIWNPRASRALRRALDPGRMGRALRARDVRYAHIIWCRLQILPISVFQKLASLDTLENLSNNSV